ncbi:putative Sensor histidine kinase [Nitrospira japonica]|uniref:histidine kinase n=1 Tax=Nitrospira japonica TaxID=1325564 RepID=A0A1W1I7L4_9BACT|nr:ATP-binding protein [Nitrospira japonica]SLM48975.1 putative Sensor histidine kinase [Nitrospira japonica]
MQHRWIGRLSIGQKFLLSFGLILSLLALSLTALLFYLSRINSYVDRHKRITVPAIVTAAAMQRDAYDLKLVLHLHVERNSVDSLADTLVEVDRHTTDIRNALNLYKRTHAARTHPILYGMLEEHQRIDLADREDRAIENIAESLAELTDAWKRLPAQPPPTRPDMALTDRLMTTVLGGLDQLVEAHTQIDIEMKHEGDRLLGRARFIALALALLLGLVIAATYVLATRYIARPLTTLAATADQVAHHDLTARFAPWPSRDEVGTLAGSLTTMLASLREQSAALMRKTKELEAFTYSIAHDLKGPLREIEGFSSLLEKQFADSSDEQANHHIGVIRSSAIRLTHMIDALLKYSRLEQQELPKQRFNVRDMIDNVVNDRVASGVISPNSVHIALPFSELYGEPVSVRQALVNLFDNAVKFSRGSPDPSIRIEGTDEPAQRVIRITDNGIGIEADQVGKIFGLFERLHGPQEYEGTGVGLAIVKLVMEKHQGQAWAESTPGAGSAFYLAFPKL